MSERDSGKSLHTVAFFKCLLFSVSLSLPPIILCSQGQTSIPEETEWTREVGPQLADPKLPNVLLLGDSITRNYFPHVTKGLSGIANVYLMASSASVGDPRLPRQIAEFAATQGVSFAVVHFSNGSHGWCYSEAQFKPGFPMFLQAIRALPGRGKLIWTTVTPAKAEASNGASNSRIDARNAVARSFADVHFDKAGSAIMGAQAAAIISNVLESSQREEGGQH